MEVPTVPARIGLQVDQESAIQYIVEATHAHVPSDDVRIIVTS